MNIRDATILDAETLLNIYSPYILETAISFETSLPTIEEFKKRITDTQQKFPWLVCQIDNEVVGYAYAGPYRSRCAYEWSVESTVYVHKEHHGKKIGKHLYQRLLELLRAQGVVNVIAGIALPNDASVGLHESLGFSSAGVFRDVGYKHEKWWDVGFWQIQLQKPLTPVALTSPQ